MSEGGGEEVVVELPEHLRQKIRWGEQGDRLHPHPQIRNVKIIDKPPSKKTQTKHRKHKKEPYTILFHDCPSCGKKEALMISDRCVALLVKQIQQGYVPEIPSGMTIRRIKIFGLDKNENVRPKRKK